MLHQSAFAFSNGVAVTPLAAFFLGDGADMLIPNEQAKRHMDLAQGYLTDALPDRGMWIGWDETSPEFFTGQGGHIPSWAEQRAEKIRSLVPDDAADVFVEYLLNDPFYTARCSYTGQTYRFALWDGEGKNAIKEGGPAHKREIRFDWFTVLPRRIAMSAMRARH